jgi:dTDP-4-dehydrorhamnose reductase
VVERRNHKKATYKQVFTTNEMRYLATLPKENKLPKHLQIGYHEVLDDLDLIRKII